MKRMLNFLTGGHDMHIHGISDNNEIIIAQLVEVMLEVVTVGIAASKIMAGNQKDVEPKSISEILTIMAFIPGPSKHHTATH